METKQFLDRNHPSYGFEQAWFQFAIFSPDRAVRKLLLVEAKCSAAVAAIEAILLQDGKVSDSCFVVAVLRQCPDIGMRSDLVDEVSYPDFMLDIVDPDRLIGDPVVASYFRESLTAEERVYASNKAATQAADLDERAVEAYLAPSEPAVARDPSREKSLSAALTGMGFQKSAVSKWIAAKGDALHEGTVQDRIREALRALAS